MMNCPYVSNILCDYSSTAGDIVCTTCPHYPNRKETIQQTPKISWVDKIKSIFKKLS